MTPLRRWMQLIGIVMLTLLPSFVLIGLSELFHWSHVDWIIQVLIGPSLLFGIEAAATLESKSALWGAVSHTPRDKTLFAVALAILLAFTTWPVQQGIEGWTRLFVVAPGIVLMLVILYGFGTEKVRAWLLNRKP